MNIINLEFYSFSDNKMRILFFFSLFHFGVKNIPNKLCSLYVSNNYNNSNNYNSKLINSKQYEKFIYFLFEVLRHYLF